MEILLDDQDKWLLDTYRWTKLSGTNTTYASTYVSGHTNRHVLLHHFVVGRPLNKLEVDHINGNGLDNRRCNLRIVTKSQNLCNQPGWNVLGLKGVYRHRNKYRAAIRRDGKLKYLGLYSTPEAAHSAYNIAAKGI